MAYVLRGGESITYDRGIELIAAIIEQANRDLDSIGGVCGHPPIHDARYCAEPLINGIRSYIKQHETTFTADELALEILRLTDGG